MIGLILFLNACYIVLFLAEGAWSWRRTSPGDSRDDLAKGYFENIQIGAGQTLVSAVALILFSLAYSALLPFRVADPARAMPALAVILGTFVLIDFLRYWIHRASHRVRLLWTIHSVHHSGVDYNVSLGVRTPWLKDVVVIHAFLPLALLGIDLPTFLAVNLVHYSLQFPLHTELVGKTPWLDRFVVTPSVHRVHHGVEAKYIDKNYAELLPIWDILFGTFVQEDEKPTYGLTLARTPRSAWEENILPWKELRGDMRAAGSWKEAVRVVFYPPEYSMFRSPDCPAVRPARAGIRAHALLFVSGVVFAFFMRTHQWPLATIVGAVNALALVSIFRFAPRPALRDAEARSRLSSAPAA